MPTVLGKHQADLLGTRFGGLGRCWTWQCQGGHQAGENLASGSWGPGVSSGLAGGRLRGGNKLVRATPERGQALQKGRPTPGLLGDPGLLKQEISPGSLAHSRWMGTQASLRTLKGEELRPQQGRGWQKPLASGLWGPKPKPQSL